MSAVAIAYYCEALTPAHFGLDAWPGVDEPARVHLVVDGEWTEVRGDFEPLVGPQTFAIWVDNKPWYRLAPDSDDDWEDVVGKREEKRHELAWSDPIFTYGDGRPFDRPQREDFASEEDWIRAVHDVHRRRDAYRHEVSDAAVREAFRRVESKPARRGRRKAA